jgi:hypothetical protein
MSESIQARVNRLADGIDRQELAFVLSSILTDLTALKTAINAHTHGGITTGSGTSGVANGGTMGSLNTTA